MKEMSDDETGDITRVICRPLRSVDQPAGGPNALFQPAKDTFVKCE